MSEPFPSQDLSVSSLDADTEGAQSLWFLYPSIGITHITCDLSPRDSSVSVYRAAAPLYFII